MTTNVRFYPTLTAPGPRQMALDDLLLNDAEAGVAGLRFYHWSEPTLSLGYFQKSDERQLTPTLVGLPWLRRATGGDAILHGDGDLTYALALPAALLTGEGWLCRMHHHLQAVLKSFGVATRIIVCGEEARHGPALCFQHHTPGDVTINGVKVIGSAQRKCRGALLQHGTIRLRRSALVPALSGISDLAGVPVAAADIIAASVARLTTQEHWNVTPGPFDETQHAAAQRIIHDRYASTEWNAKR
jgi:lipoyl(octanoyl) transferase